jgi:acyl-coenzyme A thioesterase PaaI-like protein
MTAQMTVDYLRPVPLNKPLRVESREVSSLRRKHVNVGEILNQKGEVLARGEALFISVDAERMFAKFVK